MLEMKLNFRFPVPSPKWELNVTEQNVMQWDRILKYVTVTRCFRNNYHTAKPSQRNEVQRFSGMRYSASRKSKGTPHCYLACWYLSVYIYILMSTPFMPLKKYRITCKVWLLLWKICLKKLFKLTSKSTIHGISNIIQYEIWSISMRIEWNGSLIILLKTSSSSALPQGPPINSTTGPSVGLEKRPKEE